MDIDDVGGDIGMSARIPAASYKSLIRISVERGGVPPRPNGCYCRFELLLSAGESHRERAPNDSKFYVNYRPRLYSAARNLTGAPPVAIVMTKQILCLPRVVLEDVRGGLRH